MWWERPIIKKYIPKQTKESRKIASPQITAHILWSRMVRAILIFHVNGKQPRKQFSWETSHDLKRQNKSFKLKESIHFNFTSDYHELKASKSM